MDIVMEILTVALGGALGSVIRYLASIWLSKIDTGTFPLPIMIVNITGSFLMGVSIGYMAALLPGKAKELHLLLAVGVLGGYTTFSTFSLESYMLIEKGLWLQAVGYIGGSVVVSIAALFAGLYLMRSVAV